MLRYDERRLLADLSGLSVERQAAFGASCAERLFPAYLKFHEESAAGNPAALRTALDRLWADLVGEQMTGDELKALADQCEALVPEEDESWTEQAGLAQHAAAAAAYALRCRTAGDAQEAACAGA